MVTLDDSRRIAQSCWLRRRAATGRRRSRPRNSSSSAGLPTSRWSRDPGFVSLKQVSGRGVFIEGAEVIGVADRGYQVADALVGETGDRSAEGQDRPEGLAVVEPGLENRHVKLAESVLDVALGLRLNCAGLTRVSRTAKGMERPEMRSCEAISLICRAACLASSCDPCTGITTKSAIGAAVAAPDPGSAESECRRRRTQPSIICADFLLLESPRISAQPIFNSSIS